MKKILPVLLLLLGSFYAKAQGYESIFGDSTTQWNIAVELLDAGYHTSTYYPGDTIMINGYTYKKIRYYIWDTQYSIREDTTNGRVWIRKGNYEKLISDMTLSIGDSIYVGFSAIGGSTTGFAKVDSIYYLNNRKHLRLNQAFYYDPLKRVELIEGVGPTTGILQALPDGSYNHRLICAHKDGNTTFADTSMFLNGHCVYNPVGLNDEPRKRQVLLYPNPASNQITFDLANYTQTPVRVVITDALGRTIHEETTTAENLQLATHNWIAGMYFYRISAGGKHLASGKFIIGR